LSTYDAGDARLQIFPDASGFKRRLEADLKKLDIKFAVPISADTTKAARQLEEFRAREGRNAVNIKTDVDTTSARVQLASLRKSVDEASSSLSGLGALFSGGITSPAAIFGAAGLLPGATSLVGQLAAAIEQLAGVAPVLPASLAGIAAVAGTVKLGLSGVSDAFDAVDKAADGTQKSIDAANEALGKLAPSARDAVATAARLKTELTRTLQQPIQQNLFDGLSQSMQKLYDSDIPILQQRLPLLASTLNDGFRQLLGSLGSDSSKGFLDRILGNTDDATRRLNAAIDPIVHAIGQITASGSSALPRIADAIAKIADRFDNFITNAANSGALDKFVNTGLTAFGHLSDTIFNIGKAIGSIADAAGGDLLRNVDNVSKKFADWLGSKDGREDLKNFLDTGKQQLHDINEIAKNLGPAFGEGLKIAAQDVSELLGALKKITDWYDALPGWLKKSITYGATLGLSAPPTPDAPAPRSTPIDNTNRPADQLGGVRPIPGRAQGGPIYGPGSGTSDSVMARLSNGEHVLTADDVKAMGGQSGVYAFRQALHRRFAGGGYIDQNGNPITAGDVPGPLPLAPQSLGGLGLSVPSVAPNPYQGGGINGILGSFVSGIQGPINTALGLGSSFLPSGNGSGFQSTGSFADRAAGIPGLWGLVGSAFSSNPGAALANWGSQTASWLGGFAAKTLGGFGTALWQGGLDAVGLGGSILSPNNPWAQALTQGVSGASSGFGPLLGGGSSGSGQYGGYASVQDWLNSFSDLKQSHHGGPNYVGGGDSKSTYSGPNYLQQYGLAPSTGGGIGKGLGAAVAFTKGGVPLVQRPDGTWTSPNPAWAHLIQRESGGINQRQKIIDVNSGGNEAEGLFQITPGTWRSHGGTEFASSALAATPQQQAIVAARILRSNPSGSDWGAGLSGRENAGALLAGITYDTGGPLPTGTTLVHNNTGSNEYILNRQQAQAVSAALKTHPNPPQIPNAITKNLPPAPGGTPGPAPAAPSSPATQLPPTVAPSDISGFFPQPSSGSATPSSSGAQAPPKLNHNLDAVNTAIDSGASAIGQAASTAIGIAAGLAGGAPVPGASAAGAAGAIGPYVAGLIQEGGKIVKDVVNVGSSFLVGTVTGGTTPNAYGETLRPRQHIPNTAPSNGGGTVNVFNGISDIARLTQEMDVRSAQQEQAALAHRRAR
jgi:hypothetical protein